MGSPRKGLPEVWISNITWFLAGENVCWWSPHHAARFWFKRVGQDDFDKQGWTADHTALVWVQVKRLEADGWLVNVEGQNKFKLEGRTAILSGRPDIIATKWVDGVLHILIVDAKTGQVRPADWWQVLVYMWACPKYFQHLAVTGAVIRGEVAYRDHGIKSIAAEELTDDRKAQIVDAMRRMGEWPPPARRPSAAECGRCKTPRSECADRIDGGTKPEQVDEW